MKAPDVASTLVAGMFGALLLLVVAWLYATTRGDEETTLPSYPLLAAAGFIIGAGTQVGVRVAGVS